MVQVLGKVICLIEHEPLEIILKHICCRRLYVIDSFLYVLSSIVFCAWFSKENWFSQGAYVFSIDQGSGLGCYSIDHISNQYTNEVINEEAFTSTINHKRCVEHCQERGYKFAAIQVLYWYLRILSVYQHKST